MSMFQPRGKTVESRNRQVPRSKRKKSAWTDLDQKYFEKIVKVSDVEIEKSAWTDLDQRHLEKNLQCSGCSHLMQASSTRISRQQDGSFVRTF